MLSLLFHLQHLGHNFRIDSNIPPSQISRPCTNITQRTCDYWSNVFVWVRSINNYHLVPRGRTANSLEYHNRMLGTALTSVVPFDRLKAGAVVLDPLLAVQKSVPFLCILIGKRQVLWV